MPVYRAGPSDDGSPSISGVVVGASASDSSKTPEENFDDLDTGTMGYIETAIYPEYYLSIEFVPTAPARFRAVRTTATNYNPKFITATGIIEVVRQIWTTC